jgi:hypothetical protein
MSKIAISGASTGTATFTIESPATSTNRTITIPDATTTLVGTDATQTLTNKTLTTPNINSAQVDTVSGTAPLYFARAWVNFDGTGTPSIREDGNVSSITDNGNGLYTINFTTAMPDANYAMVASGSDEGSGPVVYVQQGTRTTTTCPVQARDRTGTAVDTANYQCAIFR